jgi:subtilase family serine protease
MNSRFVRGVVIGATALVALTLTTPIVAFGTGKPSRTRIENAPAWTARAARVGAIPAAQRLQLTAALALRDGAGAEALAAAVSDPSSPQYGRYLTAAAWRSRFAPTDVDVATVTSWLRSQGFSIGAIPLNHRFISFSGTSVQAEKAFATDLQVYRKNGQVVSAPASSASIPVTLAGIVVGIGGLDTSNLQSPARVGGPKPLQSTAPATTSAARPTEVLPPPPLVFKNGTPCSAYYGQKAASSFPQVLADPLTYAPCGYKPAQVRGAYGIDQALGAGYDGRGTTVAVVDAYASQTIVADGQTYAKRNDRQHPLRRYQFSQILPTTYTNVDLCGAGGWYGEETLDTEAVHTMAPAANILYVGAQSCLDPDLNAAVNTVVDNSLAQVITNSYGDVEPTSLADVAEAHQTFIQAAAQGISVLFSSGDNGDEIANTDSRQVDWSASDPFVTAVGGTALAVGQSNNYLFEQGWGTGKSILTNGQWVPPSPAYLYGGGGGTSQLFKQPGYQKKVVPVSISHYFGQGAHRAVPDVGMIADPSTGFLVGQSQTFPDGSVRYSEYRIGGTSVSSPMFAGVVAVADQVKGGTLGFLNPKIYSLAGSSAFRDVNHGRAVTDGVVREDFVNGFNATGGLTTSLRTLNQTGTIFTRPGYDDVTGVGSPNGISFLIDMALRR